MNNFKNEERTSHEIDLSVTFDNMVLANPSSHMCAFTAMNSSYGVEKLNSTFTETDNYQQYTQEEFESDNLFLTIYVGIGAVLIVVSTLSLLINF